MKKIKKIGLVLLCLAVAAGGIYMIIPAVSGLKYKNDELEKCSVSTGGGMLGGYISYTLQKNDDGSVTLSVKYKETHADRERTDVYEASEEDLLEAKRLADEYHLCAASARRYSRMRVLDGDTTTLSFDYSKGDFSISSEQVLSAKMRKGFDEVRSLLWSLAIGEHESYLEPQTLRLHLKSGYNLMYAVEDAFDGRLSSLGEERETFRFGDCGIAMALEDPLDTEGAESVSEAPAGAIVYDEEEENVIVLYADHVFDRPVYVLAWLDGHLPSACPLIAEMEGPYFFYLN